MFDPTSPSADASAVAGESANNTTTSSYSSPYAPVTYRPLTSTPSSSSIFNVPGSTSLNSLDDPQQRRADFSAYPGTSPPFSTTQDPLAASSFMTYPMFDPEQYAIHNTIHVMLLLVHILIQQVKQHFYHIFIHHIDKD